MNGNIYQATVVDKVNGNFDSMKYLKLLGWWVLLSFGFFTLAMTVSYLFIVLFLLVFICVVPLVIWVVVDSGKKRKKTRITTTHKVVTFEERNGELYYQDIKILVYLDKDNSEVFVTDIDGEKDLRNFNSKCYFTLSKSYANDFLKFCADNNIEIIEFKE